MTQLSDAEQIVLRGFVRRESDGGAIQIPDPDDPEDTIVAPVVCEPVALAGQTLQPLLTDLASHAYLQTETRVATPVGTSGYFAVVLLASNDPDVSAYGGRKVTLPTTQGAPLVRVIQIPYNAQTVTVDPDMAGQTGLTVGASVRAIWLTDAAEYTPPTPTGPAYYTASQVDSLLTNYLSQSQLDARIQALIGAAPAALDTLAEIDAQLASDESAAAALTNTVTALSTTVAKKAPLPEATATPRTAALGTPSGLLGYTNRYSLTASTTQPLPPITDGAVLAFAVTKGSTSSLTITAAGTDVFGDGSSQTEVLAPGDYYFARGQMVSGTGRWRRASAPIYSEQDAHNDTRNDARYVGQTQVLAKGDMLVGTAPGVVSRVPIQPDGRVWTADSTATAGASWQTPAAPSSGGGGGSSTPDLPEASRATLTAPTVSSNDLLSKTTRYNTTSAINQPLPLAQPGRVFTIGWDAGANALTLIAATRIDTATVTSGSATVSDTAIVATDQGRTVTGTGIPASTFVGTVTAGTSFQLSSSPTSQVNVTATAGGTSVTVADLIGSTQAASEAIPVVGDVTTFHCTHQGLWRSYSGHRRQSALDAKNDAKYAPTASPSFTGSPTTAADPTTALGLATKGYVDSGLAASGPRTAGIRTGKLRMVTVENQAAANGVEKTLLNVTGPGEVESLWMALQGNAALDGRLRVYYDGSSTPAVDVDLGTLLVTHYGADTGTHITPHISVEFQQSGYMTGFLIVFPMPFGTSIKIGFYQASGSSTNIYSMATYRLTTSDLWAGQRLRCQQARVADQQVTRTASQTTVQASIASGPGSIVWHSQIGGVSATNLSWMERNIQVQVDGESPAAIISSGTEDWWDSDYYFEGRKNYMPSLYSYVGTNAPSGNAYTVGMATDLLGKWGGIPFTSSAVLTVLTEAGCTTGDKVAWSVLYYN